MKRVYNVRIAVVALVSAEDAEQAISKFRRRIETCGLVALDDTAERHADAFESEPGVEPDF